jgi:thiamine biosynthesis protein ThiI
MKPTILLIHYGELALKGKNRELFENRLVDNIRIALGSDSDWDVKRLYGRIVVRLDNETEIDVLARKLQNVFGIANIAPAMEVKPELDVIEEAALNIVKNKDFESFAIRARRPEKGQPFSSQDIGTRVGAAVQGASGARVDLTEPALTIGIIVMKQRAFVYADRIKGPGGLPAGSGGKVGCLISGGIDSPVACWRMMKRGCSPVFIHFHSAPFTSNASKEKAREIAEHLMRGQPPAKLITVPFGELQKKIVTRVPAKYRIMLYRRFMIRIASVLARRNDAKALVSGEVLGQVASQTLSNISTIEDVSDIPILRPLIGMDKQEIVDQAKEIGTFELSIEQHDDCCSFLMPKNPVTRTTPKDLDHVEGSMACGELVGPALEGSEETLIQSL